MVPLVYGFNRESEIWNPVTGEWDLHLNLTSNSWGSAGCVVEPRDNEVYRIRGIQGTKSIIIKPAIITIMN